MESMAVSEKTESRDQPTRMRQTTVQTLDDTCWVTENGTGLNPNARDQVRSGDSQVGSSMPRDGGRVYTYA